MRIIIDTNVLISAALYPNGKADKAYIKASHEPNVALVSDYSIDEARRVFSRKFPQKIKVLNTFFEKMQGVITVVKTPADKSAEEDVIRDINDRPILRAALKAKATIILTGDKDFLDSGIEKPKMVSPGEFLSLN